MRLRLARRVDGPAVLKLIVGLAKFEKLAPLDGAARKRLLRDAFGKHPRFELWLAFVGRRKTPVGYTILFETYSSFLALPTLYLEDIFVLPAFRHLGIGSALLRHCIQLARDRGCGRMEWTCLNWNTKAQQFYEKLGAKRLDEWVLYRLSGDELRGLANLR